MNKKKIYIAGAVSELIKDDPAKINEVAERFMRKEQEFKALGYDVINPVGLVLQHQQQNESWESIMAFLIPFLVSCDSMYIMKEWQNSRGVIMERDIMRNLNKEIEYQ